MAKVSTLDWVVIGAGLLAYISSYFPWYTATASASFWVLSTTRSIRHDAWHAGFGALFSVLLLVVAGGLVLVSTLGERLKLAGLRPLITLALSVLAFVTIVLRWVTFSDASDGLGDLGNFGLGDAFTVSRGAGFGLYLGLIAAIAAVGASFLTFRAATRNVDHTS